MKDVSELTILIFDRGYYTHVAQQLAKYYKRVYYYNHSAKLFPTSAVAYIGQGIDGVEWVDHWTDVIDEVDFTFFPYIYEGKMQEWLQKLGYPVVGSGLGEKMELNKTWFLEQLVEAGLPVPKTYCADGLDDLWEYVKDKPGPLYMKNGDKERGDWETKAHINACSTEIYLNHKRVELGVKRSKEIEILVQHPIESKCEGGIDGFNLNGDIALPCATGYEIKDQMIVEMMVDEIPDIYKPTMEALKPIYKKLGYAGPYSNENRITKKGVVNPIDETCRCASPPTATVMRLMGKWYAIALQWMSLQKLPKLGFEFKYGVEIILHSSVYDDQEIHVSFPDEIDEWVALNNSRKEDGHWICTPNDTGGLFGSVCAVSNKSWEDAAKICLERAEMIEADGLKIDKTLIERAGEVVKNGEQFGISFQAN